MPKLGSVLGATRGGQKDAMNSGRGGRSRGHGTNGFRGQSARGAARGRGRGGQVNEQPLIGTTVSNSPFAAIKNGTPTGFQSTNPPLTDGSQSSSIFGRPSPNLGAITSNGFVTPSFTHPPMGNSVQPSRDPRPKPATQKRTPKERGHELSSIDTIKPVDYQERYENLKLDRIKQRERAIKQGQMADPNQPTLLNKAITPVGTCTTMCPEFERVERIVQKMVDKSEKSLDPSTGSFDVRELKMLKRFRRSAAGYDEQLPSDIRTPNTLLQTVNYLIRHVVSGPDPLGLIHKFVWDRTRSVRNDFSVQQLTKAEDIKIAVKCLERIARFHIISLHLLSSPDNEEQFDHHQEREQLNNTMLSLMHYYDDNRDRIEFINEPEFRAYYIVLAIHDQRPDIEDRVQKWPQEIFQSPKVQVALELLAAANNYWEYQVVLDGTRPNAISQGFYERFFSLVDSASVSYLMGCVAEIYFNNVRQTAIRTIWKAYCRVPISQQHKNEDWTLDELTSALYFDNESQTEEFCEEQGLQLLEKNDGSLYLNWGTSSIDIVDFAPSSRHAFSEKFVEAKRGGRTLAAIILGLNIEQAAARGMIDASLVIIDSYGTPIDEDDNELFVDQTHGDLHQEDTTLSQALPEGISQPNPGKIAASATSTNPFGLFKPPSLPVEAVQTTSFTNIPPPSDAREEPFATNSLFSSSTNTPAPTPSWPPFSQTPITTSTPSQDITTTNTSKPSFSWPTSTQTPTGAPTNSTDVAPAGLPKPTFTWPSDSQNQSSIFKGPELLATTEKSILQPSSETPSAAPSFSNQKPAPSVLTSDPLTEAAKPHFSWPASNSQPSVTATGAPELPETAKESKSSSEFSYQSSNVTSFVPTMLKAEPKMISPKPALFPNSHVTFEAAASTTPNAIFVTPVENTIPPSRLEGIVSSEPQTPDLPPVLSTNSTTNAVEQWPNIASTVMVEQDQSLVDVSVDLASHTPIVEPIVEQFSKSESSADNSANLRRSWIETLRQSAIDSRASQANKKRPLEAEKEERSLISEKKSPTERSKGRREKILKSKSKVSSKKQKKTSFAFASIAPLPTLPILERVKKLTEVKRPTEDETVSSRTSQIDEDEILLSAARIAAEQLKNGPKLLETTPSEAYFKDSFRASYLERSINSGLNVSTSSSSSSPYARINGYDLALAPETPLGLGRTLSRTEQRLRLTGGKGLAYKPLQLTPEKEMSTEKPGNKAFDFTSDL